MVVHIAQHRLAWDEACYAEHPAADKDAGNRFDVDAVEPSFPSLPFVLFVLPKLHKSCCVTTPMYLFSVVRHLLDET